MATDPISLFLSGSEFLILLYYSLKLHWKPLGQIATYCSYQHIIPLHAEECSTTLTHPSLSPSLPVSCLSLVYQPREIEKSRDRDRETEDGFKFRGRGKIFGFLGLFVRDSARGSDTVALHV